MFLSLVTSTLLNKTGAGVVFWPKEKWHSVATYTLYGAVGLPWAHVVTL